VAGAEKALREINAEQFDTKSESSTKLDAIRRRLLQRKER